MELKDIYRNVCARISAASRGRSITLIAVSKTQPIEKIRALYELGHRDFGENYVQELIQKSQELKETCPDLRWHFIGHLQSNKVKSLLPIVSSIQSVHSLELAQEISKRWMNGGFSGLIPIFLEVNIDSEDSKSGFVINEIQSASKKVKALQGVDLRGLMCIPSPSSEPARAFRELRELSVSSDVFTKKELSMGMSSDFEIALHEGATHVRLGTVLFGERS